MNFCSSECSMPNSKYCWCLRLIDNGRCSLHVVYSKNGPINRAYRFLYLSVHFYIRNLKCSKILWTSFRSFDWRVIEGPIHPFPALGRLGRLGGTGVGWLFVKGPDLEPEGYSWKGSCSIFRTEIGLILSIDKEALRK